LLTAIARQGKADEILANPPAAERGSRAGEYLDQRLAVWQARLQLEDWKISVVLSHPAELRPGTLGNIHWDPDKKVASIRILDPSEYQKPFPDALRDMEFTLVHELVHIELAALPRNDSSRIAEEAAVNRMAEALLDLDRQENSPGSPKMTLTAK
jgi:hypothetical protein